MAFDVPEFPAEATGSNPYDSALLAAITALSALSQLPSYTLSLPFGYVLAKLMEITEMW